MITIIKIMAFFGSIRYMNYPPFITLYGFKLAQSRTDKMSEKSCRKAKNQASDHI